MALERGIHGAIQLRELARVFAEKMRAKFTQARPNAVGVGRKIEGTQRTDLPVAGQAVLSKTVTDLPPLHLYVTSRRGNSTR
jgi:hypothetical protein